MPSQVAATGRLRIGVTAGPSDLSRERRAISASVAFVIVVESLYILWFAARGFFFQDDFVDLAAVKQLGLTGRMLEQPIFGHFIPGYNLVNYLVASLVPYQWRIVESADVLLFALSLVLLYRLLLMLFGATWVGVALVAAAGASFSLLPSITWWASGLEQLVAIPAVLTAIICHVRYLTSGRVKYALCGGLAMTIGIAFYDGVLIAAVFIVAMTLLLWPVRSGLAGYLGTFIKYWPSWLSLAVPIALDLAWRFSHQTLYATPPLPRVSPLLLFIGLSWIQTFIPLLFGFDVWLLPSHADRILADLLGQVIVVLFAAWTIRRRRGAWRAWVLFGITFLAMAALVGLTRVSGFGPGDASDSRYVTMDTYFFVICVGIALLPLRIPSTLINSSEPARFDQRANQSAHGARRSRRARAIVVIGVVGALGVGYGALLNWNAEQIQGFQWDFGARQYFAGFAGSWPPHSANQPFLWDTEVDPSVVSHAFFPYDTATYTVAKLYPFVRIDRWGGTGYVLRSDGSVARAVPVTQARGVLPPAGICRTAGSDPAPLTVDLNHALGRQRWFGEISYASFTGALAGQSGGETVQFPKGRGTLLVSFPPVPLSSIAWTIPAHHDLCVSTVQIVIPKPVAGD